MRSKVALGILLLVAGAILYGGIRFRRHGFSARESPSRLEAILARHARRIATPSGAKELTNPHTPTAERIVEAREHFVEHCAICHGLDGRGDTPIGRNLYPKVPDMADAETQGLSDGELFYIISNGVRFTGMPAWGSEDSPESVWGLVAFIRRLPQLSPDERRLMEKLAGGGAAEKEVSAGSHVDSPGAKPHEH